MTVVTSFTVPAEDFALGRILEVEPGIQVRLESMVPIGESVVPFFWVPTDSADDVAEALDRADVVAETRIVREVDDETLFDVRWTSEIDGLIDALTESRGIVLDGVGTGDDWTFEVRFRNHDHLSTFYDECVEAGIGIELGRVFTPDDPELRGGFGLTEEQHEAILVAYEAGYFEVPRETTLTDLGDRLQISDSAFSQRLRRGLATLIAGTLLEESTPGDSTVPDASTAED